MIATRTYLELTDPASFLGKRSADPGVKIERSLDCTPAMLRYLYADVGRDYHWVDRLPWTDEQLQSYLDDPAVSVWLLSEQGTLAGYFELRRDSGRDDSTEIAYFGLLPGFLGRGLGGHLLTEAVERAWADGARRVWLHTCSFDHPAALANYLKRGFVIFKREQYDAPDRSALDSHA
jgi:GNAT superfamily N-acetyltransferase